MTTYRTTSRGEGNPANFGWSSRQLNWCPSKRFVDESHNSASSQQPDARREGRQMAQGCV